MNVGWNHFWRKAANYLAFSLFSKINKADIHLNIFMQFARAIFCTRTSDWEEMRLTTSSRFSIYRKLNVCYTFLIYYTFIYFFFRVTSKWWSFFNACNEVQWLRYGGRRWRSLRNNISIFMSFCRMQQLN